MRRKISTTMLQKCIHALITSLPVDTFLVVLENTHYYFTDYSPEGWGRRMWYIFFRNVLGNKQLYDYAHNVYFGTRNWNGFSWRLWSVNVHWGNVSLRKDFRSHWHQATCANATTRFELFRLFIVLVARIEEIRNT